LNSNVDRDNILFAFEIVGRDMAKLLLVLCSYLRAGKMF
jgi:hypothetical protein